MYYDDFELYKYYAGTRLNVSFINSNPIGKIPGTNTDYYPGNLLTADREITI